MYTAKWFQVLLSWHNWPSATTPSPLRWIELDTCLLQEQIKKHSLDNRINVRAWHDQPIDQIRPLRPPIWSIKGQVGMLKVTLPLDCSATRIPSSSLMDYYSQPTRGLVKGILSVSSTVCIFYCPSQQDIVNQDLRKNKYALVSGISWYINCHPQTDCFLLSQTWRCFQLGSKPGWLYISWIS